MTSKPTGTPSSKKPKPLFILPKSHFDKAKSSEDALAKRPPTPYYPPARQFEGESSGVVGDEKGKDHQKEEDIKDAKKQN